VKIEGCEFPDDVFYEPEGLVWARLDGPSAVVGITSIHAALGGKLTKVAARPTGLAFEAGRAIGTLEGSRYFGPIRTPISGILERVNDGVLSRPRVMSESPYGVGWFARVRPARWSEERNRLLAAPEAIPPLRAQIAALHVRCFAAFPDYEMVEIGTECAAVLIRLDGLLAEIDLDEVVHIVSDDPTAPIEMVRWSDRSGQPVVDTRREGDLYHFLVRKAR